MGGGQSGGGAAPGEKHITSTNYRNVILALASVDIQARVELIKQTKEEIDIILGLEGGKEFVTEIVKME